MSSVGRKITRLFTQKAVHILILATVSFALAGINFFVGYSGDVDGHFLYQKAARFAQDGLLPSRSWGFPAYELLVYPLVSAGSVTLAKGVSLLFFILAGISFYFLILRVTAKPLSALFGALCFTVLPVSIISGNSLLETSQGVFLSILSISLLFRYLDGKNPTVLLLLGLCAGMAVSTRPDYLLLSLTLGIMVIWLGKPPWQWALGAAVLWLLAAGTPYLLYPNLPFGHNVLLPDPFLMKLARAGLGVIILLGLPAWIMIIGQAVLQRKHLARLFSEQDHFRWSVILFFLCWLFFGFRFILLPDEIEYIIVLAALVILLFVQVPAPRWSLPALLVLLALPNVVQIHLFTSSQTGQLSLDPGVSPGAVIQDRSARLMRDYQDQQLGDSFHSFSQNLGYEQYFTLPVTDEHVLIFIPHDQARFYSPARFNGKYYQAVCRQDVYFYPMPSHRGWRQSIQFEPWQPVSGSSFEKAQFEHCPPGK